jgi:hypothetical protein
MLVDAARLAAAQQQRNRVPADQGLVLNMVR